MPHHPKHGFTHALPPDAVVLDIGCWNFSYARHCHGLGVHGFRHPGVDVQTPPEPAPPGYTFKLVDVNHEPLPFPDQSFDGVVASHVIEHLNRPLWMMDEIFRVLKVGGILYLECPSDRSLRLP